MIFVILFSLFRIIKNNTFASEIFIKESMNRTITTVLALVLGITTSAQSKRDSIANESKIDGVELFGEKKIQPKGLEVITRLPLKTREQIQSISVVSYKVIEDLGGLTVTDVAKNVPGVTQFGSYGGTRESMSIRGYRGVPVLKNGVLMDSDFRTGSMLTDMQGVESIQVIKGSAAVTQGIGDGLGSAGGVINVVTKSPRFINETKVGMRVGSWDFYRPTLDFQRVLDNAGKVAVRLNGAYQNSGSFRDHVGTERIYVNPSIAYRIDDKTSLVAEMDYMKNDVTPDRGTVNLASGDVNAIYTMPKGNFLGYATDNVATETFNYSLNLTRQISDKLKLRAAYISSSYDMDNTGASLAAKNRQSPDEYRFRTIGRSAREDQNKVFQFDLIGAEVNTGFLNHTFQVGFDWKQTEVITNSYAGYKPDGSLISASNFIDEINVKEKINNALPYDITWERGSDVRTMTPTIGFMAQDVIGFGEKLKAHLGVRYSKIQGVEEGRENDAWNPSFGLMYFPIENLNVFGSYTTTTSLRSANNKMENGSTTGPSVTKQWEMGIKSDWLDEKLRFNLTLFDIQANNLSYSILNESGQATGFYGLAGDLKRKGVEVEIIGRILSNLQIMTGWAYLDAQYKDSPAYVEGSAPMNTPKHTANAWLNYKVADGALRGLDFGAGVYFVGERPVDDYTQKTYYNGHTLGVEPGVKPFMMKSYTTVDAQVGYQTNFGMDLRIFFNNIFDEVGYNSYFRGGFIDQIPPRNVSAQISYKF